MAIQETPLSITPALQCRSLDGWYPYEAESGSDPDKTYIVHVCDCKGYQFRGSCRHQKEAHLNHCGWNAVEGPEKATDEQEAEKVCPRCGGPTGWAMWEQA
jgi:hypothetical protein